MSEVEHICEVLFLILQSPRPRNEHKTFNSKVQHLNQKVTDATNVSVSIVLGYYRVYYLKDILGDKFSMPLCRGKLLPH